MKCTVKIDPHLDGEIVIVASEHTELVERISRLISGMSAEFIGYRGTDACPLAADEIFCFIIEDSRLHALTKAEKYRMRERLCEIEQHLTEDFVKINQSCIANIHAIERFSSSIGGSLKVIFKNGFTDYVSRRQLKAVKAKFKIM